MKVEWQQVPAEQILRYFVDGYKVAVPAFEWFYDASRQTFVLKLFVEGAKKLEDLR